MKRKFLFPAFACIIFFSGCSGSGSGTSESSSPADTTEAPVQYVTSYWNTPTPNYSHNPDRPTISLIGPSVVAIDIGDQYEDAGANAQDLQDGDISANIVVEDNVNTSRAGDYLLRYNVSDLDGNTAFEAVRIVRVYNQTPQSQTKRPVGETASHLGYLEHLPRNYEDNPEDGFPLLIFHHGSGSNINTAVSSPSASLDSVIFNGGPPLLLEQGAWNEDLPFIVLSPQRAQPSGINAQRIDAFVEFAKTVYNVDHRRIYMAGWSQGGFVSLRYAVNYPYKVAAIAPIAGGFFRGIPGNLCGIGPVSVWAFHGSGDQVISLSGGSQRAIDAINACEMDEPAMLSVFPGQGHAVHQGVFDLSLLNASDGRYDLYNQSVYEWLLSKSTPEEASE